MTAVAMHKPKDVRLPRAPEGGFASLAWTDAPCAGDPEFERLRDDVEDNAWLGWTSGIYAVTDYCHRGCPIIDGCDRAADAEHMDNGVAGGHIWIGGERQI